MLEVATASPRMSALRWMSAKRKAGREFFHWERRGVPVVWSLDRATCVWKNCLQAPRHRSEGTDPASGEPGEIAGRVRKCNEPVRRRKAAPEEQYGRGQFGGGGPVDPYGCDRRARRRKVGDGAHQGRPGRDPRIKEFKATVRCTPLVDEYDGPGKCILTGETVDRRAVIAKAY